MSVCGRCAKALGRSCCEVAEGEHLATLTDADVRRIEEATGRSAEAFSELEWLSVDEARAYEERRPLYAGYFASAPARRTLRRRDGACVFLVRGIGCSLPVEARPTACRLYPFELFPGGEWSVAVERHGGVAAARASGRSACLAVEEASSMDEVLEAFGTTCAEVEALGEQLREEVAAHGRARERRRRFTLE